MMKYQKHFGASHRRSGFTLVELLVVIAIIEGWKLGIPEKYQAFETTGLTATVGRGSNRADFKL